VLNITIQKPDSFIITTVSRNIANFTDHVPSAYLYYLTTLYKTGLINVFYQKILGDCKMS